MEKKMSMREATEAMGGRWGGRDRLVALCVADYTDLALGLGETRMGISVFACSSASLAHAHERASRMGHEAGAIGVDGRAGEDFKRMLGMAGRAWSKMPTWNYRFLDIHAIAEGDMEIGIVFARGDLGNRKPDVRAGAEQLRRLISMYGVESSEATPTLWVTHETSTMSDPAAHPMLWNWLARAASLG